MARVLRFDMPHSADRQRWAVGLLLDGKRTRLTASLVAAVGHGLQSNVRVVGAVTAEVPRSTASRLIGGGGDSCSAEALTLFRCELAEIQAAAVHELVARFALAPTRVMAVGVDDPGLWQFSRSGPTGYLGLCDAARLAELTGQNVLDAFPARDLAQGGLGGPITALPHWVLLKHPLRSRVLLKLGQTVRMSYLPAAAADKAASRILSFDVGPGTCLLDRLARQLSGGRQRFDPGGSMAAQGRRITQLIEHWLADPYFERPLPRWHPHGVRPERFLADALQMAVDADWSVRDVLCSATHFIAETVAAAMRRRLAEDAMVDEIVVTGGGQQNGMLLREIAHSCQLPLRRIGDLEIPVEAFASAAIAVLALLHLDQVPANPTAITGTGVPRLLGRLTPGSPQSWQQLLRASTGHATKLRPLRSAV